MLNESTLRQLYQSAVDAFPNTTKRQHATHPIVITHLTWLPYLGVKTLFVKGLAQSEGKEYNPLVLFKGVNYHKEKRPTSVELMDNSQKTYFLEQLSFERNDALVRCNCPDFHWRFQHYDKLDKSLYGKDRKKYVAITGREANPMKMEGMCKHIMKLMEVLGQSTVIQ